MWEWPWHTSGEQANKLRLLRVGKPGVDGFERPRGGLDSVDRRGSYRVASQL